MGAVWICWVSREQFILGILNILGGAYGLTGSQGGDRQAYPGFFLKFLYLFALVLHVDGVQCGFPVCV